MEIFGNLERVAASLYPYRWPVSAMLVLAFVGAAYLVYERGWHTVAWRRPMTTAIVAVPLLAIMLPLGYYTLSPLWTRTHLDEASPLLVAAAASTPRAEAVSTPTTQPPILLTPLPTVTAISTPVAEVETITTATPVPEPAVVVAPEPQPASEPTPTPMVETVEPVIEPEPIIPPEPVVEPEPESTVAPEPIVEPEPEPTVMPEPVVEPEPEPVEFVPAVVRSGSFYGADDFHFGSGTALIIETEPGVYVLRFEEFSVQNGPDLFVYLSTSADGYGDGSYNLGQVKATDGSFNYDIPAGIDPWAYGSVIIWCEPFAVLFATAPLV